MSAATGAGGRGSQGGQGDVDASSSRWGRGPGLETIEETDDSVIQIDEDESADGFILQGAKRQSKADRRARWQKEEAERRAKHPQLYTMGYADAQVRRMLAAIEVPVFKTPGQPPRGRGEFGHPGGHAGRGGSQYTRTRGGPTRGRGGNPSHAGSPARVGRGQPTRPGGSLSATPGLKRRHAMSPTGVTPPAKKPSPEPDHARGGSSYAKAAAVRESFPHMLTVFKGHSDKCPLSDELFSQVAMKLRKRVLAYSQEDEHIMLRTAFIRWHRNAGKIACRNKATADWYREEIAKIDIDGVSFRAWDARDLDQLHVARMNISGLEGMEPEEILQLLRGFTPELDGVMKVTKVEGEGRGLVLVLGIDDKMAHSLANLDDPWQVNLGTDQRKIQFSGKRALKDKELARDMEDVSVSRDSELSDAISS